MQTIILIALLLHDNKFYIFINITESICGLVFSKD